MLLKYKYNEYIPREQKSSIDKQDQVNLLLHLHCILVCIFGNKSYKSDKCKWQKCRESQHCETC